MKTRQIDGALFMGRSVDEMDREELLDVIEMLAVSARAGLEREKSVLDLCASMMALRALPIR